MFLLELHGIDNETGLPGLSQNNYGDPSQKL